MDPYRLFVCRDDRHLIGRATTIHATNDAEAIARAEVMRGSWAAERRITTSSSRINLNIFLIAVSPCQSLREIA
jgi:hypothetical protein